MSEKCVDRNCCPVIPGQRWRSFVGYDGYHAPDRYGAKGARIDSRTDILLGVELEIENNNVTNDSYSDAYHVFKDAQFGIFKGDGSLDDGVEINSVPATLDAHYDFDWPKALKTLNEAGFVAKRSCGIHIHLSYRPLSDVAITNIAHFIYGKDNFDFVRFVAGRHSETWARYKGVDLANLETRGIGRSCGLTVPAKQYRLTDGRKTLEFRLFASTLNEGRFMARLEFVHALAVFANTPGRTPEQMNVSLFTEWLGEQSKYGYLRTKVEEFDRPIGRFRTVGSELPSARV